MSVNQVNHLNDEDKVNGKIAPALGCCKNGGGCKGDGHCKGGGGCKGRGESNGCSKGCNQGCNDCKAHAKEKTKDKDWAAYTHGCEQCEKRMIESAGENACAAKNAKNAQEVK